MTAGLFYIFIFMMEKFIHKVKKFFTVKNTLMVIIGALVLVIIVQNVHRAG
jgi:hypothetical protein